MTALITCHTIGTVFEDSENDILQTVIQIRNRFNYRLHRIVVITFSAKSFVRHSNSLLSNMFCLLLTNQDTSYLAVRSNVGREGVTLTIADLKRTSASITIVILAIVIKA
jgi:hypothetical protein